jgi:hypothetical protein
MAIDGTWRRECVVNDVSEADATLTINTPIDGLHLTEFFLLLSSTGLAYRRCALSWVNGEHYLPSTKGQEKNGPRFRQ